MQKKSCVNAITDKYDSLTGAEKKIADYILSNPEAVLSQSVSQIAGFAQTAQSAVVRCCKSLGFSGFKELKIALAMERPVKSTSGFAPYISPGDTPGGILDKVFESNIKTLADTAEKINREKLSEAIGYLAEAKTIYIFAVGTSAGLAVDFQYRLMQFGFCAFCVTDVPTMKIATLNMTKDDVAFAISHSGRTVATIEALELAGKRGSKTVCLTSYPESRITRVCDCPLSVFSDEVRYPVEAVSARIGHMSVLDSIAISLSAQDYEHTLKRSAENRCLIDTIRYND